MKSWTLEEKEKKLVQLFPLLDNFLCHNSLLS